MEIRAGEDPHFPAGARGPVDFRDVRVFEGIADGLEVRHGKLPISSNQEEAHRGEEAVDHRLLGPEAEPALHGRPPDAAQERGDDAEPDQGIDEGTRGYDEHQSQDEKPSQPGPDHVPEIQLVDLARQRDESRPYEKPSREERDRVDDVVCADPRELCRVRGDEHRVERDALGEHVSHRHGRPQREGGGNEPQIGVTAHALREEREQGPGQTEPEEGNADHHGAEVRPASHGEHPHDLDLESKHAHGDEEQRRKPQVGKFHFSASSLIRCADRSCS